MEAYLLKDAEIKARAMLAVKNAKDGAWLEIKDKDAKRSLQQNAYYWKILSICEESGHSKKELNRLLKKKLNLYFVVSHEGERYMELKSSSDLGVKDFGELIVAALMLADELGYSVPDPKYYGYDF